MRHPPESADDVRMPGKLIGMLGAHAQARPEGCPERSKTGRRSGCLEFTDVRHDQHVQVVMEIDDGPIRDRAHAAFHQSECAMPLPIAPRVGMPIKGEGASLHSMKGAAPLPAKRPSSAPLHVEPEYMPVQHLLAAARCLG